MMVVIAKPMSDRADLDTRTRMIVSATQLFREQGLSGTGFRDVVTHSGAPRGSIYHHFPGGKNELAEEAVRFAGATVAGQIERAAQAGSPQAMIQAFTGGWRRRLERSEFRAGCPVIAVAIEADAVPDVAAAAAEAFAAWEALLAQELRRSGIPRARAGRLATLTVTAIEGAVIQCRVARSTAPLDEVERELVAVITAARPAAQSH